MTKAVEINENSYYGYYLLGNLAKERGNYSQALDYYDSSLKYNPDYVKAYLGEGLVHLERKEYQNANSRLSLAVEKILDDSEVDKIVKKVKAKGGFVSYKINSDGSKSPYELNISYLDAIRDKEKDLKTQTAQFMASQSIMLVIQGVPGIYFHSLVGSENYQKGVKESGVKRKINREKLARNQLLKEINEAGSFRKMIFDKYRQLLKIRKNQQAFSPEIKQKILKLDSRIFALQRAEGNQEITALTNLSAEKIKLKISRDIFADSKKNLKDLISGKKYIFKNYKLEITLNPYQIYWLK